MAIFKMHVEMDNAAFKRNDELIRILRNVADRAERLQEFPFTLRDVNGNTVGTADVIE